VSQKNNKKNKSVHKILTACRGYSSQKRMSVVSKFYEETM